jgi:hypothetical protein
MRREKITPSPSRRRSVYPVKFSLLTISTGDEVEGFRMR